MTRRITTIFSDTAHLFIYDDIRGPNVGALLSTTVGYHEKHLYSVLFKNTFCHSGLAAVPTQKLVKTGVGGGGAHGV